MAVLLRKPLYAYELDPEVQEFYDGIIDMFTGIRQGHLGRYCFSNAINAADKVRGDEHWTNFINSSPLYYPYRDQVEIIRRSSGEIGRLVCDASTFVDLGTGSLSSFEHKVLPLIRAGKFDEITFVDLCMSFSKLAAARLQKDKLDIRTSTFIGNFFNEMPILNHKAAITLFGITLGNIIVDLPLDRPEQVLARTFKHFAKPMLKKGGYFIFDYDTNLDGEAINKTYDHPSYHSMEMTILERVKRDLPTADFYPDDFEHVTKWYPEWNLLAQELRSKCDQRFSIGAYKFDIEEGQSYRTGSSFKYSDKTIETAANQAGFKKLSVFSIPCSTMRVAVYEFIPSNYVSSKNICNITE